VGSLARWSGRPFQNGFEEGGFVAGEVGFERVSFSGVGGGGAGDVLLLDQGAKSLERGEGCRGLIFAGNAKRRRGLLGAATFAEERG